MSKIQWTDETWNPAVGCAKVSAGCRGCYAERDALRVLRQMEGRSGKSPTPNQQAVIDAYSQVVEVTEGGRGRWTGRAVPVAGSRIADPLRWTTPRMVFVNSMSDLFHEDLPFEWIAAVFGVMAASPQHTFQVLTKRPARALEFFRWLDLQADVGVKDDDLDTKRQSRARLLLESIAETPAGETPAHKLSALSGEWPLPNVWLGVSVEDQATANERVSLLLQCPAAIRFVSYEPALGAVEFRRFLVPRHAVGLDWIIVGGESGPFARRFDVAWARDTVEQCAAAGVPVFIKQLGSAPVRAAEGKDPRREIPVRLVDRKGGNPDEWPGGLNVRQWPAAPK